MLVALVDDEAAVTHPISNYLAQFGHQCEIAANGREALEILNNYHVDVLVTDLNMPEMTGIELAQYLHQTNSPVPIIIMTGNPDMVEQIDNLPGSRSVLIKPFSLGELLNRIEGSGSHQKG